MFYLVTIEAEFEREAETFEITRYVEASDTVTLFDELGKHPAFMSKELGYVITMVQPVTEEEYLKGKSEEKDPLELLRKHVRFRIEKKCIVEASVKDHPFTGKLDAETTTCSLKGVGLTYSGVELKRGDRVTITIPELKLNKKKAEVVWTSCHEGVYRSGLMWL